MHAESSPNPTNLPRDSHGEPADFDAAHAAPQALPAARHHGGRPRAIDGSRPICVASAAKILGVSKSTIRSLLLRGALHAVAGAGPIRFAREEILRVASLSGIEVKTIPTDGDVCSQVFRAYKEGRSVRDVVIDYQIPPDYAEQLLHRYATMGAEMVFPGEVARQIQALGFFQNRAVDPREIPQILRDLLAACEQLDPEAIEARAVWNQLSGRPTSS